MRGLGRQRVDPVLSHQERAHRTAPGSSCSRSLVPFPAQLRLVVLPACFKGPATTPSLTQCRHLFQVRRRVL